MRLDKLLSNLKYGSRNEIKKAAKDGLILLNGVEVKDSSTNVRPEEDEIVFDGLSVFYKESIYLMMNKPAGYICANEDGLHKTVIDLIKPPYDRFDWIIVGRLDIDTEGLLLLTTDGNWAHKIISPKHDIYKKYYVKLRNRLCDYQALETGIEILDGNNKPYITKNARIEKIDDMTCYIYISEGKFHQVKRMFEFIGNEVVYLKRVAIGDILLDDNLKLGDYKEM